jgi:hypothetical protein
LIIDRLQRHPLFDANSAHLKQWLHMCPRNQVAVPGDLNFTKATIRYVDAKSGRWSSLRC